MKRLGEKFKSNNGEYCTIIEKLPNSKYKIQFDSGFILVTTYGAIQKDKNYNEKVYSLNTCLFTNKKENFQHRNYKSSNKFKAINADGDVFISENLHDFCRTHNISQPNAHRVLNGTLSQTKGWTFYKYDEEVLNKNGKIRGTQ